MAYAVFEQASGKFEIYDEHGNLLLVFAGAAGAGVHRNNPKSQGVRRLGPLPRGAYAVKLEQHERFRSPAFRLVPDPRNEMLGRSGFWVHGGTKSAGCVLIQRPGRLAILRHKVDTLYVVPGSPKGED